MLYINYELEYTTSVSKYKVNKNSDSKLISSREFADNLCKTLSQMQIQRSNRNK